MNIQTSRGELILKRDVVLGDDTIIKNVNDLIHRDAKELRDELEGIDKNCELSGVNAIDLNDLTEGRARLKRVIDSGGSDTDKAHLAEAKINARYITDI